jgi:hypothetical protein
MLFRLRQSSSNLKGKPDLLLGCTNRCRAVNHARWDLLQSRFEGSRQRFADEQARAAAEAKGKSRLFGYGRERPAVGVERTLLVRLQAAARRSGNAKSLVPH